MKHNFVDTRTPRRLGSRLVVTAGSTPGSRPALPLLHLQMRAIEATEIERRSRRLTKLEKQLAKFQINVEQGRAGS
jgi:hypothetical protein